jgi:amino acid transporter
LASGQTEASVAPQQTKKFSLFALTAMVVGSMVGAGIWSLPRAFGTAAGVFGAIVAWIIAAGGMYTLARVFQALAERKPDLDAGVYAYAKAGFGNPSVDFLVFHERNWSTAASFEYGQWLAGVVLKAGWRF